MTCANEENMSKENVSQLKRCAAIALLLAASGAVAGGSRLAAQPAQQSATTAPDLHDISGYWELSFDSRKIPPADLASGVTKTMLEEKAAADTHAIRYCNLLGTPFIMDPGRPLDVRQGTREVIITAETNASPRHIYLDRPKHVAAEEFDTTSNGDSIAHWDGDTLVVDTVGFDPKKGLVQLPGGGFRTADSHLVERYRLLENGTVLSVVFTWEDEKVFRMPHTYEFRYYRMPKQYEPVPAQKCDPYDEVRDTFLDSAIGMN
jgi:hypothetical protein